MSVLPPCPSPMPKLIATSHCPPLSSSADLDIEDAMTDVFWLQIAESFRRFGIAPTTQNLLVIKVSSPSAPFSAEEVQKHLSEVVEGEQIPFEDDRIEPMTDVARVKKIYKLNATGGSTASKKGQVNGVSDVDAKQELMGLVISSMALRGAAN